TPHEATKPGRPLPAPLAAEPARLRHPVVQRDRIEIEAVRPGERAQFDKDAREERRVLERPHHLAVACRGRRKIVHAFRAIGERNAQAIAAERLHRHDVNHFDGRHTSRQTAMASWTRATSSSRERAWVWHPASAGTEAT